MPSIKVPAEHRHHAQVLRPVLDEDQPAGQLFRKQRAIGVAGALFSITINEETPRISLAFGVGSLAVNKVSAALTARSLSVIGPSSFGFKVRNG